MSLGFTQYIEIQDLSDIESVSSESSFDMSSIGPDGNTHATVSLEPPSFQDDSSSVQESSKFYFREDMVIVRVR